MLAGEHTRAALAERHRLIVGALRLPEHEVDQPHDEQARQQETQGTEPIAQLRRSGIGVDNFGRRCCCVNTQALELARQIRAGILARCHNRAIDLFDL